MVEKYKGREIVVLKTLQNNEGEVLPLGSYYVVPVPYPTKSTDKSNGRQVALFSVNPRKKFTIISSTHAAPFLMEENTIEKEIDSGCITVFPREYPKSYEYSQIKNQQPRKRTDV